MNIKFSPIDIAERKKLDLRAGDTIKVTQKITEKDKKTGKPKFRFQAFEGLCLAIKHGREAGATITLRKVASGVGVERIFPIYSPSIEKIEVTKRAGVRRAKLYHIRKKAAKEIRRQMRNIQDLPEITDSADPRYAEGSGETRSSVEPKEEIGVEATI